MAWDETGSLLVAVVAATSRDFLAAEVAMYEEEHEPSNDENKLSRKSPCLFLHVLLQSQIGNLRYSHVLICIVMTYPQSVHLMQS